ncbi:MAG: aminoacyl-tRNA hydrolase [Spongiibacter sp.]|uniref:Peptidyl-tRNA hydrolase n=1 Tax=Spongiibacter thalassae TaxID=2721624 RepID=A0ABX1GI99_9GAMM|nr:aminoacyl-tRNA hydrolase [Spongiibacter thalassae]MDX1505011.1 aminoacyl-tRNA hydrolase [Spongiibacter sp.]NKI18950.1 aminoacyl-tRNA hydrolase [Spongiibacter thalassae]
MDKIKLIVGLANPGQQYQDTRHNAGAWFVAELARQQGVTLTPESRFFGDTARIFIDGSDIRLLVPSTFMNRSGQAIAALAGFYKILPEEILIAHDELDLPPGSARFKTGGGHGGHNGLRDSISQLGNNKGFHRLRIGIGHPGSADKVTAYVLGKPSTEDRIAIDHTIDEALRCLPWAIAGDWAKAMNHLHSFKQG